MKITTTHFENESYYCRDCDKDFSENQVDKDTWCCDVCGKKIMINIGMEDLVRLLPREITKYDDVYSRHEEEFYRIKGVSTERGKYKLGIAQFGSLTVNKDEFINCRWNDH